jgi:class 3 adenylate cyclase
MSWNYDDSLERIGKHLDSMGEIEIEKLVREADLETLLTETCCREIHGAHVYADISTFARIATESVADNNEYKRLIQGVHIYQREVSRIVETIFGGLRIHFQGSKLHALFYRPIDDPQMLATKAFLLLLVLKDFVNSVFNPSYPLLGNFSIAGGADVGDAIGTRNGRRNDRELLFLGACANYAAKIISSSGRLRISKATYDALPDDLQDLCEEIDEDEIYQVDSVSQKKLDELLEKYEIEWDREKSQDRVDDDKRAHPLKDIEYSSANELIDLDVLSIWNNKRVLAVSVFGDITGFTAYIDRAESDEEKRKALRVLHAIRKEMATVVAVDFNGLRVQFQGDRVQGLYHMPKDEETSIATEAVEAAIGLQSSMEKTIKEKLPEAEELQLAVGVDIDTTLVSKLGTRAHRDRICLGSAVENAAKSEEKCSGGQLGVSRRIYEALPERLSKHFSYDITIGCYVAKNLTADKVERAAKAAAAAGAPAFITSNNSGVTVTEREREGARTIIPGRSYAED